MNANIKLNLEINILIVIVYLSKTKRSHKFEFLKLFLKALCNFFYYLLKEKIWVQVLSK